MTPEQIAAALGVEWDESTALGLAISCQWCGTRKDLEWRRDHFACHLCIEGGGGEYANELAMRVSRKMSRVEFAKLPRDDDGNPVLPSLTWRAWKKLRH